MICMLISSFHNKWSIATIPQEFRDAYVLYIFLKKNSTNQSQHQSCLFSMFNIFIERLESFYSTGLLMLLSKIQPGFRLHLALVDRSFAA